MNNVTEIRLTLKCEVCGHMWSITDWEACCFDDALMQAEHLPCPACERVRQSEDRIHRVKQPVEIIHIDVDEYARKYREDRAILDKILDETNEVIDD